MLEVEVLGARGRAGIPPAAEVRRLCRCAAGALGVERGHVAVEFVDAGRIAELNERHLAKKGPTDVLSFPIDGLELAADGAPVPGPAPGAAPAAAAAEAPPELGDVVICPEHTRDVPEAIVHGMLHLLGMDHERDGGEMLALQARIMREGARA